MNSVVVLDACTIVNLARIDEGDFLEDKIKALTSAYAVEKVIDEVKDRYVPSNPASKRRIHYMPYWGGLRIKEDVRVADEVDFVKTILNYQKKPNGELYSAALSLYLSRKKRELVLFYTDDFPAKNVFGPCFEFQQLGYIGDSVDLLIFLYWLSPIGTFSERELEKYLTALRGEYSSKIKELQDKINQYALMQSSSKDGSIRRFKMEGLSANLSSRLPLGKVINNCKKFFDGDTSAIGKEIILILDHFSNQPLIVEKIDTTLQNIAKYGVYKI